MMDCLTPSAVRPFSWALLVLVLFYLRVGQGKNQRRILSIGIMTSKVEGYTGLHETISSAAKVSSIQPDIAASPVAPLCPVSRVHIYTPILIKVELRAAPQRKAGYRAVVSWTGKSSQSFMPDIQRLH